MDGVPPGHSDDDLSGLVLEKDEIVRKLKQKSLSIEALDRALANSESKQSIIERSLEESGRISKEIEDSAYAKAQLIEAEAEQALMRNRVRLNLLEEEINELDRELEYCSRLATTYRHNGLVDSLDEARTLPVAPPPVRPTDGYDSKNPIEVEFPHSDQADTLITAPLPAEAELMPVQTVMPLEPGNEGVKLASTEPVNLKENTSANLIYLSENNPKQEEQNPPPIDDSVYNMKLVAFLNAKHYMVFAGKKGQTHGHSWQFQADVSVVKQDDSFIKFENVDKNLNKILAPYQKMVLNDISPFDQIEPLTENLTVYFFNILYDELVALNGHLNKLTVWENPTKGIEISRKTDQFFSTNDSNQVVSVESLKMNKSHDQAAAAQEYDNLANEADPQLPIEPDREKGKNDVEEKDDINQTPDDVQAGNYQEPQDQTNHTDLFIDDGKEQPGQKLQGLLNRLRSDPFSENVANDRYAYPWWQIILASLAILGTAIWAFWPLLTAPPDHIYPLGSDSWAHMLKADYLYRQILQGNYYPQFMPFWHNGVQPYRYWAPLPWALMAIMNIYFKNIFLTGIYYIVFVSILGGVAWLAFSKRIGLGLSVLGGMIWVFWLDNIRVCFSDGNLTRLFTVALLPFLLAVFMDTVESSDRKSIILTMITISVIVYCHAMMAAIYCVSLVSFAFIWWLLGGVSLKGVIRGGVTLVLGLLTTSWWLIPSLKGGLVGMGSEANGAIIIRFLSPLDVFNPNNIGAKYFGISLVLVIVFTLFTWRRRPLWVRSLFIFSILTICMNFPVFKTIQGLLPLHDLLWPIRFSSIWSLFLVLSIFTYEPRPDSIKWFNKKAFTYVIIFIFFIFLAADSYFALRSLAVTTTVPSTMQQYLDSLNKHKGWRVATLDLCGLGAPPSYYLSFAAHREQVYGWGWQGAQTATNVMLINMAIEFKWYPYIFERLDNLGTTDLLLLDNVIKNKKEFNRVAGQAGYSKVESFSKVSHWHKANGHYMIVKRKECLAIGKYASIYAIQFPSIEIAQSQRIDDYTLNQLEQYPRLVLAGSTWASKSRAEELVKQYVLNGGKVLVDLTNFPQDELSRQPKFLDVYGEAISITQQLTLKSNEGEILLAPFTQPDWRTIVPQGLDGSYCTFPYYGNEATALGYKLIASNKPVYFLGGNLAYHSFLTHDPNADKIINNVLNLPGNYTEAEQMSLANYKWLNKGYSMDYHLKTKTDCIIPIAALEGMTAKIDGKPISISVSENLINIQLPPGYHKLDFRITYAPIFYVGGCISIVTILFIILFMIKYPLKKKNPIALAS